MANASSANFRAIGQQIAQQIGVPWNVWDQLIAHESGWNPNEVSPAGAIGFGQLMPGTAAGMGIDPHDPVQNLRGSALYFKKQLQTFGGNVKLALAAYNAGPGAVQKYGGVPPFAETQRYVASIMAAAGGGAKGAPGLPGGNGQAIPPGPVLPGAPKGLIANPLQPALDLSRPSDASVGLLSQLGGMAGRASRAAQAPIPLPQVRAPQAHAETPGANLAAPVEFPPMVGHQSQLRGQVAMQTGGNIGAQYPNIRAQSHVDWSHVNPRLLAVLQKEGEKRGVVIVLNSGYRSSRYSQGVGGFANDPHTQGIAVDAYINGHPIGDVISPQEWAKYGIRSGNTPGFYHGKPDPEHLDLVGHPLPKAVQNDRTSK